MRSVTPVRSGGVTGASPGARFVPAQVAPYQQPSAQKLNNQQQQQHRRSNSINNNTNLLGTENIDAAAPPASSSNARAASSSSTQQKLDMTQIRPVGGEPQLEVEFQGGLHLVTQQLLGKGGFARVLAAKAPSSGESYALKVCENMSEQTWKRLQEEVRILQMFQGHQNIVHLYAASRVENIAYLAMERCVSSSLHDILNNRQMSLQEVLWVGHQLLTTIHFIHEHNCIHRDLKPQNILFDYEGNVKVIDFGLSSRVGDSDCTRKTVAGTAVYMAPEMASHYVKMLQQEQGGSSLQYGREVDLWSFGVVMFVMATRSSPYWATYKQGRDAKTRQRDLFNAVAEARWQWPPDFTGDAELMDLIELLLNRERNSRPSLERIMNHQVWKRRPYTCPLALLRTLRLVETNNNSNNNTQSENQGATTSPLRPHNNNNTSSSQHPNNNLTPTPYSHRFRVPESEVIRKGVDKIEQTEKSDRACTVAERMQELALIDEYFTIGLQELNHRGMIRQQQEAERMTLRHEYRNPASNLTMVAPDAAPNNMYNNYNYNGSSSSSNSRARPSSRAESVQIDSSKPLMSDFRRQRATSVNLVASSDNNNNNSSSAGPRFTPIGRGAPVNMDSSYSGSGTRRNIQQQGGGGGGSVSQGRAGSVMPTYIPKCLNGHQMSVSCKLPFTQDGWHYEVLECNGCNEQFKNLSKSKCMFRCTRCDFDVCYKCIEEQRPVEASHVCMKCSKCFTTEAKMRTHFPKCRGPSTSPSPARADARNTLMWNQVQQTTNAADASSNNTSAGLNTSNNSADRSSRRSSVGDGMMGGGGGGGSSRASLGGLSTGGSVYLGGAVQPPPTFDEMSVRGGNQSNNNNASYQQQQQQQKNVDDDADANLSPIQAAIARRHREREQSEARLVADYIAEQQQRNNKQQQQQGGGDDDNDDDANRLSAIPQPGKIIKPHAREPYKHHIIDYNADDYIAQLEGSTQRPNPPRRSQSSARGGDSQQPNKFHRSEDDEGAAPANRGTRSQSASRVQVNLQSNFASRPQDVLKPPAIQGGGRKQPSRARSGPGQQQNANSNNNNNNQHFQQPFFGNDNGNYQQPRRQGSGGQQGGGRSYFNGPAEMIGQHQNNNNSRSRTPQPYQQSDLLGGPGGKQMGAGGGRRVGSVHAPSPSRQGPQNKNSQSRGRDVSRPADNLKQPNKPPRLSAQHNNTNNMLMMGGGPQQQQQQQQQMMMMSNNAAGATGAGGGGGAFLALPRRDDQRTLFVDEFLRGSWVRHYAFATNDVAILYYCLQPGRFGALFQNNGTMATVVVDIHSKLVLIVSSLKGESTNRNNNPMAMMRRNGPADVHVDSEYDEDARVMPLMEAQQLAGPVIGGILDYVNEITRMRAEGHVPVYVPAAYVHNSGEHGVPADTKFSYIRRVFPDPDSSFTLFRLSNLRSQIICTTHALDIRWQSDRRNHVGCKYYVYQNGEAQPFSIDSTGILSRVERVLTSAFTQTGR